MMCVYFFFFFKQKTAYEMRISDWSSDVCSSDLQTGRCYEATHPGPEQVVRAHHPPRAIGDRDREIVVIERLEQHRPVGRGRLAGHRRGKKPAQEQDAGGGDRQQGRAAWRERGGKDVETRGDGRVRKKKKT